MTVKYFHNGSRLKISYNDHICSHHPIFSNMLSKSRGYVSDYSITNIDFLTVHLIRSFKFPDLHDLPYHKFYSGDTRFVCCLLTLWFLRLFLLLLLLSTSFCCLLGSLLSSSLFYLLWIDILLSCFWILSSLFHPFLLFCLLCLCLTYYLFLLFLLFFWSFKAKSSSCYKISEVR